MAREVQIGGRSFLLLAWEDIMGQVDNLSARIEASYRPDTIVGILRGGLFVANLLSDIWGIDEVYPLGLKSYRGIGDRGEVHIYHWPKLPRLDDRQVLLVDDVSDEGKTLWTALNKIILPLSPKNVKTAVLHIKPWTAFQPDYFVVRTGSWILYPWSRYESWRQLSSGVVNISDDEAEAERLISLLGISRERAMRLLKGSEFPGE
ncbi:MAG: phosphoribosyltransferase [Nitrososphaerota archaeon]|nr:phosphoribosyltransferase [Candidatus Calditenuaceae archaeon]MDW8072717.1 phosphoribosyltransferase [Nitrososphaerota archaeon]